MQINSIKKYAATALISGAICLGIGWQAGYGQIKVEKEKADLLGKTPSLNFESLDSKPSEISSSDMQKVWNVWRIVTTKYLEKDKLTTKQLLEGAMAGIVQALNDPYSEYLNKEQNDKSKETYAGNFEGVGMTLGFNEEKQLVVMSPIPGSPAEKAGIQAGDKVWFIDDKQTPGMTLVDAVNMIRGEKGTKVSIKMQRGSGPLTQVDLIRDTIHLASVTTKELENNIMYVRLNQFGDSTKKEWDDAVKTITDKKIKKIILDVRNNGGGYIDAAIYINSDFTTGLQLQLEDYKGQRQSFQATQAARLADTQLVVLVNKGSASSSEIVSGGLQDKGFAKLVGETTFGKGIIQEMQELPEGTSIHLTVGKWLLPSGKWIHKTGVTPDYEVKFTEADIKAGKDVQLNKALELMR